MTAAAVFLLLSGPVHAYPVDGVAQSFEPIIYQVCDAYAVPRWLGMRLAKAESSFRPWAQSGASRGLFQINATFQDEHALRAGIKHFDWRNPEHSARAGIAYLAYLIKRYHGDLRLAVAGYNWGPANVDSVRPWPAETINHVRRVLG